METSIIEDKYNKERIKKKQKNSKKEKRYIEDSDAAFKILIGEQDISPEEFKVENLVTSEDTFNNLLEKISRLESYLKDISNMGGMGQNFLSNKICLFNATILALIQNISTSNLLEHTQLCQSAIEVLLR